MHEQSVTVGDPGQFWNVYGQGTLDPGKPLPQRYGFERPQYKNLLEAVMAAKLRSLLVDQSPLNPSDYGLSGTPDSMPPWADSAGMPTLLDALRGRR